MLKFGKITNAGNSVVTNCVALCRQQPSNKMTKNVVLVKLDEQRRIMRFAKTVELILERNERNLSIFLF